MYCAGCGASLPEGTTRCTQCGKQIPAPTPPLAAAALEENSFARTIRMLSRFYLYFAALNLALAAVAVCAAAVGAGRALGPWEPWPHPPLLEWTYLGAAAWSFLALRVILSAAAWLALKDRADCGRPLAIIAAVLAFTQFPIGLLLGAFTLGKLVGKRSARLYTASVRA